ESPRLASVADAAVRTGEAARLHVPPAACGRPAVRRPGAARARPAGPCVRPRPGLLPLRAAGSDAVPRAAGQAVPGGVRRGAGGDESGAVAYAAAAQPCLQ